MFKTVLNTLWKNQNWLGKLQTLLIVLLIIGVLYFRAMFGIYKHKEIKRLQNEKTKLTQKVIELSVKRKRNNNKTKKITQNYKAKASKIEQKRKTDEEIISNSTVTDQRRKRYLSKHQKN